MRIPAFPWWASVLGFYAALFLPTVAVCALLIPFLGPGLAGWLLPPAFGAWWGLRAAPVIFDTWVGLGWRTHWHGCGCWGCRRHKRSEGGPVVRSRRAR